MKIISAILLTFFELRHLKCADGYPDYFGPFNVIMQMNTGSYFVKKLVEEFSANTIPIDWTIPRNDSTPFKNYSVFINASGNRRFVSQAKRLRHNADTADIPRHLSPQIAYVHLDQNLWLETRCFQIFNFNTQQTNHDTATASTNVTTGIKQHH
ncbi:uncharacterized protein LOC117173012 [Belonocnema kinseyi]|uniref:uncharacterized protein LOC117173012 n=1 Tax=Belonocnema kinseyi TaxID=2817044 RepID=UPI00143E08C5|nr:uncharacterized protein LOC117173012 [Belonocnema kinseyi]